MLTIRPTAEKAKLELWDFIGKPEDEYSDESWTGYSKREMRVLQNTNVKLARMLSRSKIKFRIFFILDPQAGVDISKWEGEGPVKYSRVSRELKRNKLPVPAKDPSSINVLLSGMGESFKEKENLPPTPWIIIHWIAHGVMKKHATGAFMSNDDYNFIKHDFTDTLGYIYTSPYVNRIDDDRILDFMHSAFQFRSARKRMIRNIYEGMHDLMAEYIIRGDIRVGPLPDKMGDLSLLKGEETIVKDTMDNLMSKLKERFDEQLKAAKGRWYII